MNKFIILLLISLNAFSASHPNSYWSANLGMNNVTFTEIQSTLVDSDGESSTKSQLNGSASIMSLELSFTKPLNNKNAVMARGIAPLIGSDNRMFSGGIGYLYFFGDSIISDIEIETPDGSFIHFEPGMRFFAGATSDVSYLFYTGRTAKKTDLIFNIGPMGGLLYRYKNNIDIKAQGEYAIGYGSVVTTSTMRMFIGITYQL